MKIKLLLFMIIIITIMLFSNQVSAKPAPTPNPYPNIEGKTPDNPYPPIPTPDPTPVPSVLSCPTQGSACAFFENFRWRLRVPGRFDPEPGITYEVQDFWNNKYTIQMSIHHYSLGFNNYQSPYFFVEGMFRITYILFVGIDGTIYPEFHLPNQYFIGKWFLAYVPVPLRSLFLK